MSKKGNVELLRSLADNVRSNCSDREATTQQIDEWASKMLGLEPISGLLPEESGQVGALQQRLNMQAAELTSITTDL